MTPGERLYEMVSGYRVTQFVRTAALLGVCDELAGDPREAAEVAAAVGADPGLLRRLLRALAGSGVVEEGEDGRFRNTPVGDLLRRDAPGGLRDLAIALPEDRSWAAWGVLPTAIREGIVPFDLANGRSFWEALADDPGAASDFNRFMVEQTEVFAPQLLKAFDFSASARVVDVGGGTGALIAQVLVAHPALRATLFDLEAGLEGADAYLRGLGVHDRCQLAVGSFFETVPEGADTYLLKYILHDWDDGRAAEILAVCRRAMRPGARLIVIDHVLPARAVDAPRERRGLTVDMQMHVLFGSRERTEAELRAMLVEAGFAVERVVPTTPPSTIVARAL